MQTTEPITSTAAGPPSMRYEVAEVTPLVDTVFVAGPPALVASVGTVFFALMLAGPFALLVTFAVALAALAALVTLAGAIVATPYLIVRHVRRRLAQRRDRSEGWTPIATAVAPMAPRTSR